MALIKCPECKKKISDKCGKCPNCGYPINESIENNNTGRDVGNYEIHEKALKPFYKQLWFGVILGIAVVVVILATVLFINCDIKPRYNENGEPEFVEFTSEVYTNSDDYLGYFINIKGKVFQVMGDNGNSKGIQIWIDPDSCEHNLMIYYDSDVEVEQGDYVICTGYIDSVTKYKNAYDAELEVPLVYSSDLKKASYIEVIAPTTEEWVFDNLKIEQFGYAISINKVEFSDIETRIYATVTNAGKDTLNVGDAIVVQNGKQYNSEENYDADYEKIPYETVKGVSSSGIIVLPVISNEEFELMFDLHSNYLDEELGQFVFKISKENQNGVVVEQEDNAGQESEDIETDIKQETSSDDNDQTQVEPPVDTYQLAINKANALIYETDFVTREWAMGTLENVYGFTLDETIYAIENCSIDWKNEALDCANSVARECEDVSVENFNGGVAFFGPNDLRSQLESYSYTMDEIAYAMDNCFLDWNNYAAKCASALYSHGDRESVISSLLREGYTQEQAEYGADNCGVDWSERE